MLHQKTEFKKLLDEPFVNKEKDLSDGEIVTIEGESQEYLSNYKDKNGVNKIENYIKIKTRNGLRYAKLLDKSANILIDEFESNDDKNWVGKEVKVILQKGVFGGKKGIALYLVGKTWELDEYGELCNVTGENLPEFQTPDPNEDSVNIEEVPF